MNHLFIPDTEEEVWTLRHKGEVNQHRENTMPDRDEGDSEVWGCQPPRGFLTSPDDPTVGGNGFPFGGIGCRQLPEPYRTIGAAHREELPYR